MPGIGIGLSPAFRRRRVFASAIVAAPATLYVGVEATLSGTADHPDGGSFTVLVSGESFATAAVYSGMWSVTAAPTAAMVGTGVTVSVPGDSTTVDVVQPYLDPNLENWTRSNVTISGGGDDTAREIVENSATNTHFVRDPVSNTDANAPLILSYRTKRGDEALAARDIRSVGGTGGPLHLSRFDTQTSYPTSSRWYSDGVAHGWEVDGDGYVQVTTVMQPVVASALVYFQFNPPGASTFYAGNGQSSIWVGNIEVSQYNHATSDWYSTTQGNEVVAVVSPANGQEPTGATITIRVTAPSQPAVFVDGSFVGWATRTENAIWEYEWTSSSGAHTIQARAGVVTSETVSISVPASSEGYVPVVLVLGQSNALYLTNFTSATSGTGQQVHARLNNGADATDTTPATSGTYDVAGWTGRGAGLVAALGAEIGGSTDYGLVCWGLGGTDVVNDWEPLDPAGWWQTYGLPFIPAQVASIEAATGLRAEVVGIVWHQGESTAANGTEASYIAAVEKVLDDLLDLYPKARIALCEIHGYNAARQTINDHIHTIAAAYARAEYVMLQDVDYEEDDNVHMTQYANDHESTRRISSALGFSQDPQMTLLSTTFTSVGLSSQTGDDVAGRTLTVDSATSEHGVDLAAANADTGAQITVVFRAKRTSGNLDVRAVCGAAYFTLDLSGGGSHVDGGVDEYSVTGPDADSCYHARIVFPLGDATPELRITSSGSLSYLGDGTSAVFVDDVRAYQ